MKKIAIIGGGPAGMFMLKRLLEGGQKNQEVEIFERSSRLGAGMPYSELGAKEHHVTNVSDNEIPTIVNSIHDWIHTVPDSLLNKHAIQREKFNEYKVLPRLFFGDYLEAQFRLLLELAKTKGIKVNAYLNEEVLDIVSSSEHEVTIKTSKERSFHVNTCVICIGHHWPLKHEGHVKGYFDSPYPPHKLSYRFDHPVAIRGTSLTAVDAIRTLSRHNGTYQEDDRGNLRFYKHPASENFKLVLHSRSGMLPAVRFHLEDSHLSDHNNLSPEMIKENRESNNGFLSLDFVFEKAFKEPLEKMDRPFYEDIKDMSLEEFVSSMLSLRERLEPFTLLQAEYREAEKSIRRRESVYWKEMLANLSFSLNYPAKHFSAEDMERLQSTLSHLISIVIAFIPQSSAKELMALHEAKVLEVVAVGHSCAIQPAQAGASIVYLDENNTEVSTSYETFVDCIGQRHLEIEDFPFKGLVEGKHISQAYLKYSQPEKLENKEAVNASLLRTDDTSFYKKVSGITINDHFQIVDSYGKPNESIYLMAVPYISGYNPDYSGLDFGEAASGIIGRRIFEQA